MANLTKKALRYEIWAMLPDKTKKEMATIKKTYLDSIMADAESYANGKILDYLKSEYGCNGIASIEAASGGILKVNFNTGKPMIFNTVNEIVDFIKSESAAND